MKPDTRTFYEDAVRAAVRHIVGGLDAAIDLGALARRAAMSPYHFHRIFRGMVGETALELHRRLRLERAAWCLVERETPVTSIAFEAGYETHEAFTRAFRKAYACSPSEARQSGAGVGRGCAGAFHFELATPNGVHFRPGTAAVADLHFIEGGTIMNVEIVNMTELRTASVRHVGPYNRISEAFARLGSVAGAAGLIGQGSKMLAIYHDDPESTAESELRSDACISVDDEAKLPAELGEQRIRAGRYARTVHVGAYTELGDAWARFLGQWLPSSGERLGAGQSFEVYENTPLDVPTEQLRTLLYLPLAG